MPSVSILGLSFELPSPYSAGHPCSPAEARTLNTALAHGLTKALGRLLREELIRLGYGSSYESASEAERKEAERLGREQIEDFLSGFSQGHERKRYHKTVDCDWQQARPRAVGHARKE